MTSSKLSLLTRTAPMLSLVLMVGGILFAGPLATVQQTAATTTLTAEEQNILDTQDSAREFVTEEDRDVNGIEFTPRWGAISTLEPNQQEPLEYSSLIVLKTNFQSLANSFSSKPQTSEHSNHFLLHRKTVI